MKSAPLDTGFRLDLATPFRQTQNVDKELKPANRTKNRGQGPKDANQVAFMVVQQAIGEVEIEKVDESRAVTIGRLGGLKGGKARADKLTAEQRRQIAAKAASSRWGKNGS